MRAQIVGTGSQHSQDIWLAQAKESGMFAQEPRQQCRTDMPYVKNKIAAFRKASVFDGLRQFREGDWAGGSSCRDPAIEKGFLAVIGFGQVPQRDCS